jgi:hypothetical protein
MEEKMIEIDYIEKVIKEGYALTDEVIAKHLKKNHINYVCRKGCSICCENMELPVLMFEMIAIRSYIKKLNDYELKNGLIDNIKKFDHHQPECPFLIKKLVEFMKYVLLYVGYFICKIKNVSLVKIGKAVLKILY